MTDAIDAVGSDTPIDELSEFGAGGIGKEDFLLLLVTQLRHQDPLDPLDAQDFASQLAEFTAMEQQILTNDLLETQIDLETAGIMESQNSVAIGMIGTGIVTDGDLVELAGSPEDSAYIATTGAATMSIDVTDASGNVVLTVTAAVTDEGIHRIDLGEQTEGLPPGHYTLSVELLEAAEGIEARPLASGVVQGVRWGELGPVLVVGSQEVPLSSVLEITN